MNFRHCEKAHRANVAIQGMIETQNGLPRRAARSSQ